jgi:hypothetical protein
VAFSHEQQKACMTGGYLLAETSKCNDIVDHLFSINQKALQTLARCMADGEVIKPSMNDEKAWFQWIKDLDYIRSKIEGSVMSKKRM